MTREETIKWLESLKAEIGKSEHRTLWHYAEAIDMATEAMSREQKKYDAICDELLELKSDLMLPIEVAMAVVMKYAMRGDSE